MKPKVGIYGVWHPGDEEAVTDLEFFYAGRVNELAHQSAEDMRQSAARYDAVILAMYGAPTWETCEQALPMLDKTKVGVWSLDSHNEGWLEREQKYCEVYDGFFTCCQWLVPELGNKSAYIPSCCVWEGKSSLSACPPLRQQLHYDFSSVCAYYLDVPRHNTLMQIQKILASGSYRWMMGQTSHREIHSIYSNSRVVVNCCAGTSPNIRSFEALAAGAFCLQSPCDLFADDRFSDLREFQLVLNAENVTRETLDEALRLADRHPVPLRLVREKHLAVHRYAEMARRLLLLS